MREPNSASPAADRCPLCGQPNQCALACATEAAEAPADCSSCWCQDAQIPQQALDRLTADARGRACICAACCNADMQQLPAGVTQVQDPGGRDAIRLDADGHSVLIAATGAQILSWRVDGKDGEEAKRDVLWTASSPSYAKGKPVRGGIPVVFPWFGDHQTDASLPAHGFARSLEWQVAATDKASVTWTCRDTEATRKLWDHPFELALEITLSATLRIEMRVRNTGQDHFAFEQALHTYFDTGDILQASVHGLENIPFVEHAREPITTWDPAQPIRFGAETDRVFQGTPDRIELRAPARQRSVTLETRNARSAIVWNPWPNKTARLSQMQPNDWQGFCCIESANVGEHQVELAPGQSHAMTLELSASQPEPDRDA